MQRQEEIRSRSRKNKNGAVASAVLVHLTRGSGPLRLALAGATRSGSAGVGGLVARSADEATPHPPGDKINFGPAAITDRALDGHIGDVAWRRDEQAGRSRGDGKKQPRGSDAMIDTILAYLISLGIIGAGVVWVVAGTSPATVLFITVGVLTIAVGLISLLTELRQGRY
jgi:hypothetical protein